MDTTTGAPTGNLLSSAITSVNTSPRAAVNVPYSFNLPVPQLATKTQYVIVMKLLNGSTATGTLNFSCKTQ